MTIKSLNRIERLIENRIENFASCIEALGGKVDINDLYIIANHLYRKEFSIQDSKLNFYHFLGNLKTEVVVEELQFLQLSRE